jgi:prevent-host-death family protein
MKVVSVKELKRRLSAVLAEAAAGVLVVISRHGKPLARITSADLEHLRVGRRFGKARLRPVLRSATRGQYLRVLAEDRAGVRGHQ